MTKSKSSGKKRSSSKSSGKKEGNKFKIFFIVCCCIFCVLPIIILVLGKMFPSIIGYPVHAIWGHVIRPYTVQKKWNRNMKKLGINL